MTKIEWNRAQRIKNKAAGKCRCGRPRMGKRATCRRCIMAESDRRDRVAAAGLCRSCRKRSTNGKSRRCRTCREATKEREKVARALYSLVYPGAPRGYTLGRTLRTAAPGQVDVSFAVLAVAAMLERHGRPGESAVLKLELGELLMRAGLHGFEHPGPVSVPSAVIEALSNSGSRVHPRVSGEGTAPKSSRRGQD